MDALHQQVEANGFPWWVIRKVGEPLLLETTFAGPFPNTKFGVFENSTGTVTNDTANLYYGGTGSAKMLTAASTNDGSEIKTQLQPWARPGDLIAFEQKWAQSFASASTKFQMGFEVRSQTQIRQARFSYTVNNGWQYESALGVYSNFSNLNASYPNGTSNKPQVDTASGSAFSWGRLVVDPYGWQGNGQFTGTPMYYSFEAPIYDGNGNAYPYVWNMRGTPLTINGACTQAVYLAFCYVIAGSASAEPGYTTDWCISRIPQGIDPQTGHRDNLR